MRLIWKIILITLVALALLIVIALIFVGYTAYQGYTFYKSVKSSGLEKDVQALAEGNCSKLPEIELKYNNLKQKAKSSCKNFLIRWVVSKTDYNICLMIKDNSSELDAALKTTGEICAFQERIAALGPNVDPNQIIDMNITIPEEVKSKLLEKYPELRDRLKDKVSEII